MENLLTDNTQRFERKYVIEPNKSWIFRSMLIEKKFMQIYSARKVLSLYFDNTFAKINAEMYAQSFVS